MSILQKKRFCEFIFCKMLLCLLANLYESDSQNTSQSYKYSVYEIKLSYCDSEKKTV